MNTRIKLIPVFIVLTIVFLIGGVAYQAALGAESIDPFSLTFPYIRLERPNKWIGPDGGIVVELEFDPKNPTIAYAGTWGGGVFKSYDAGQTWQPINNGIFNLYIESLAVSPVDTNIIYAGTHKGKLYRSWDGGATWQHLSSGIQAEAIVYSIAIDPYKPKKLFIGTRGESNNGGPPWNGIVYMSDDYGNTWLNVLSNVGTADEQDWAYSLAIHPLDTDLVFAATHEHGIYKSWKGGEREDGDDTFYPVNTGITNFTMRAVVADPVNQTNLTLYSGVWTRAGVYKSTNAGDRWVQMSSGLTDARIFAMTIDPIDTNTLYLSTFDRGIMKTNNGALSWSTGGLNSFDIYDVAVKPNNNRVLLSGVASGGLYRSTDRGNSWQLSQKGLTTQSITGLIVDPTDPNILYASTTDAGVLRTLDQGQSWVNYSSGLPIDYIYQLVPHPAGGDYMYALTETQGLWFCHAGTTNCWVRIGSDLPSYSLTEPVFDASHPFASREAMDWPQFEEIYAERVSARAIDAYVPLLDLDIVPTQNNIFYLATAGAGVQMSLDGGLTWEPAGLDGMHVWSVVADPSNPSNVYAATNQPGLIYMSADSAQTWTSIPLTDRTIYDLIFTADPLPALLAGTDNGIYRYTGTTWEHIGLAAIPVTRLAVHPTRNGVIHAGTSAGAYVSLDGGASWIDGPSELNGFTIQAISYDPHLSERVYFATKSFGILKANVVP